MLHDKPAVPDPPAVVGEAEEDECFGRRRTCVGVEAAKRPNSIQTRLVLVEPQAELGQPFLEVRQHPPCLRLFLEAHHEVVGVADDRDSTVRVSATPLVNPEVEDIVQDDAAK
jgi:hypothetical protein